LLRRQDFASEGKTPLLFALDGKLLGILCVADTLKEDSARAIEELRGMGIRTVMLTGDSREVAAQVAGQLGINEYHAALLPADKVAHVEQLLSAGNTLAFVGDGISDAPVLARADVGIAMGGLGSDAAMEAADVVLMDDKPSKIAVAVSIARRTIGIARQNVTLAIGVKCAVLLLATVGLGNMWMAVFADVGVTVVAVLNAMRTLR
jgi:Cd2+/Zn2+-exporting ATPase